MLLKLRPYVLEEREGRSCCSMLQLVEATTIWLQFSRRSPMV